MSLFEPKIKNKHYGFFGYEGTMIDRAVNTKNAAQIKEAHENGWINHTSKTLDDKTLRNFCRERNAVECDRVLAKLGYPE